jgi:hypothetical protein
MAESEFGFVKGKKMGRKKRREIYRTHNESVSSGRTPIQIDDDPNPKWIYWS